MKRNGQAALVFAGILSLVAGYLMGRMFLSIAEASGDNLVIQLLAGMDLFSKELARVPLRIDFTKPSVSGFLAGFLLVWMVYLYKAVGAKNYRHGEEHGSAQWGTYREASAFRDPNTPDNNILLSADIGLMLKGRPKSFENDRNKNVLVVGGPGSGKTRFIVKPNLMQMYSSYVITDPKGTLLPETGKLLSENGYKVRSLNTINFKKSLHYNPLAYIHSEKDILKLVTVIMENTKGEGEKSGEDFWVKAERLLYCALIAYLYYEANEEDRNIPTMIDMLDMCGVREDDEAYVSAIDILFEELEQEKPACFAVKQYKKFKQAAGKTMKSILISCGARLAPFDIAELRELTMYDELELDQIGDRKTAFYVMMSDTDNTYAFVVAMCLFQMFNLLCDHADDDCGGKLPIHVSCILDELANIGKIPGFHRLVSTIRSRQISVTAILQSLTQLKSVYKDDAETIIDCCDTFVFLGGKSTKTTKSISEMIGKSTIDNQNVNESRGQNGSYSLNNQILARDLLDPAEVGKINRNECIILISGAKPFRSRKYDITKHRRYPGLADSDNPEDENIFDITAYRKAMEEQASQESVMDMDMLVEDWGEFTLDEENLEAVPELNEIAG